MVRTVRLSRDTCSRLQLYRRRREMVPECTPPVRMTLYPVTTTGVLEVHSSTRGEEKLGGFDLKSRQVGHQGFPEDVPSGSPVPIRLLGPSHRDVFTESGPPQGRRRRTSSSVYVSVPNLHTVVGRVHASIGVLRQTDEFWSGVQSMRSLLTNVTSNIVESGVRTT